MKKNYLKLCILPFLLFIVACRSNIEEVKRNVELVSIEIDTTNAKIDFDVDTPYSNEGVRITGKNSDGTIVEIDPDYCKFDSSLYDSSETKEGIEIGVFYGNVSSSYFVNIVDKSIVSLLCTKSPDITLYDKLPDVSELNLEGLEIQATYSNGTKGLLDKDYILNYTNIYYIGVSTVQIFYGNLYVEFNLLVTTTPISKIRFIKEPNKVLYKFGDKLDCTDMLVYAEYGSGGEMPLPNSVLTLTDITDPKYNPDNKDNYDVSVEIKLNDFKISDAFVVHIIANEITGIKIEPNETAPLYYFQNETIEKEKYNFYYVYENDKTERVTDPIDGIEYEKIILTNTELNKLGIHEFTATYTFTDMEGNEKTVSSSYQVSVTDALFEGIVDASFKRNENAPADFPLGIVPSDSSYGTWSIKGKFKNKEETFSIDSKFCNFEYVTPPNKPGKYDVKISYYESRTNNNNADEGSYRKDSFTFIARDIVVGEPRLLEIYSKVQCFEITKNDYLTLNTIKTNLVGRYTNGTSFEELLNIDENSIIFGEMGRGSPPCQENIQIHNNIDIKVQIKDRYNSESYLEKIVPVAVQSEEIIGLIITPNFGDDNDVIYITSDPGDFDTPPNNIVKTAEELKSKFSFYKKINSTNEIGNLISSDEINLKFVPEESKEFYKYINCRVYAEYTNNGKTYTSSYYSDSDKKVVLVPPKIVNINVTYMSPYAAMTEYNKGIYGESYNRDKFYWSNKEEVINAATYEIVYSNGKSIPNVNTIQLNRYNIYCDYFLLYNPNNGYKIDNGQIENIHKFKLYSSDSDGYYVSFSEVYELPINEINDLRLSLTPNNTKINCRLGETYDSSDLSSFFITEVSYTAHDGNYTLVNNPKYELDLVNRKITVTVEDVHSQVFSTESYINILPPEIESVVCNTYGIVYDKYYDDNNFDFILYFKDGSTQTVKKNSESFLIDNVVTEKEIKYTVNYESTQKDIKNTGYSSKYVDVCLIAPIITKINLSIQGDSGGINPSSFESNIFDITLTGIDGLTYKYLKNNDASKPEIFYRSGTESDKNRKERTCHLNFECKKNVNNKVVVCAYFTDDYENTIYAESEEFECIEESTEIGDSEESGETESSEELSAINDNIE